ncbi:hypothetical protein [Streptomyces sp. NPDC008125]|uniref:hypothetical protein n=1 Tax=Streptomyces sp. NPDC008125 TaxID=3364811 RepID=UPI0036EFF46D
MTRRGRRTPVPPDPDRPENLALLDHLRARAARPGGPHDMDLDGWQLHTHPDLQERFIVLASGHPVGSAYGVPVLSAGGVAAAVAYGTGIVLVRVASPPENLAPGGSLPPLTDGEWFSVDAWQADIPQAEGTARLCALVREAVRHTRGLGP